MQMYLQMYQNVTDPQHCWQGMVSVAMIISVAAYFFSSSFQEQQTS
jgi:hypothetical protein